MSPGVFPLDATDPAVHLIRFRLLHASGPTEVAALSAQLYCTCGAWESDVLRTGPDLCESGPDAGLAHEVEHGTPRQLLGHRVVELHRGEFRGLKFGGSVVLRVPELGWVGDYRPTWKNGEYRGTRPKWCAAWNPTGRDGKALAYVEDLSTSAAAMRWLLAQVMPNEVDDAAAS